MYNKDSLLSKVIIDDSSVIEFLNLVNSKDAFNKETINKLLDTTGYERLIRLGGPNIGIDSKDKWVKLFNEASNSKENEINEKYNNNIFKRNILNSIYWGYGNCKAVESYKDKLIKEIQTYRFIDLVNDYIPKDVDIKEIRINLVVGVNNCFGVGNDMIVDVDFIGALSNDEIMDILAHELHHMFRNEVKINYNIEDRFKDIQSALFWLESEGIADLCNFERTSHIYEDYDYIKKGAFLDILNNITYYFKELDKLICLQLKSLVFNDKISRFLTINAAFHPLGYTMAKEIKDKLGIKRLQQCVGDELEFFLTFCSCTEKCFSDEAILGIKEIYRKH